MPNSDTLLRRRSAWNNSADAERRKEVELDSQPVHGNIQVHNVDQVPNAVDVFRCRPAQYDFTDIKRRLVLEEASNYAAAEH
jgi:hypothetical protein